MAVPIDWVPVLNASAAVIPSGGVMHITGQDPATGAMTVSQVATDGDRTVLVNGMSMIPPSAFGQGHFGPRVIVAYDPTDGIPVTGQIWGAKAGTFFLGADLNGTSRKGFYILGGAGLGLVNAIRWELVPRGFPATLTTCYQGPGYGYSWEQTHLDTDTGTIDIPTIDPATGGLAFCFDGTTTLGPGTTCWIEPSPDGAGYIITSWDVLHPCSSSSSGSSSGGGVEIVSNVLCSGSGLEVDFSNLTGWVTIGGQRFPVSFSLQSPGGSGP